MSDIPLVLVHGWKSHSGIWKGLISHLERERTPCWIFDHVAMNGSSLEEIAAAFLGFIQAKRDKNKCSGEVDIVCHSMGTGIARYMLEVIDGNARREMVRQLIGIGPPNNGSAMAELFNHPMYGREIIQKLRGTFVPEGYNPADDIIVQQFRPGSNAMKTLRQAGTRDDIRYRVILAANLTRTRGFFPPFGGKTWEFSGDGTFQTTWMGDGIVPHSDSYLPGAMSEVLPGEPRDLERCGDYYCHIRLPRNPEVIERVIHHLKDE